MQVLNHSSFSIFLYHPKEVPVVRNVPHSKGVFDGQGDLLARREPGAPRGAAVSSEIGKELLLRLLPEV
jgi:hypothetical protein